MGQRRHQTTPFADVSSGATYTPAAADVYKYLKATASYTDPQGSGKRAEAVSNNAVQSAPVFNVELEHSHPRPRLTPGP